MQIISIKRSKAEGGLKVYGKILGDSGNVYNFGYIRRADFRGWLCSCTNFLLEQAGKHRNCKHLHFVRQQVGRYGATVEPTRAPKIQSTDQQLEAGI